MEEIFYVNLENSKEFRKTALEATRLVIQTLQSLERLKNIRTEKAEQMQKLSSLMQEINGICDEIKIPQPALDVETMPPQMKKTAKKKIVYKSSPEAQQLEQAISSIEQKLKKLG